MKLHTWKTLAKFCGYTTFTLQEWEKRRGFPRHHYEIINGKVTATWDKKQVLDWFELNPDGFHKNKGKK